VGKANPLLSVRNLSKSFGGVLAVAGVTFDVPQASVTALIGPNGAGKSTILNLVSGNMRPGAGEIRFKDRDISRAPIQDIVSLGLSRSFQMPAVFPRLSALENVQAACLAGTKLDLRLWRDGARANRDTALELLDYFDLAEYRDELGGNLSHGDQRRLELAMCLASKPDMLLLDEPTQGLSATETQAFCQVIRELRDARGLTILLVEHDMSVVFNVCDHVLVLNFGALLASGSPDAVRSDPAVRSVYLGDVC
jgi:branched-chain amino acid transport system ATP-binding protein